MPPVMEPVVKPGALLRTGSRERLNGSDQKAVAFGLPVQKTLQGHAMTLVVQRLVETGVRQPKRKVSRRFAGERLYIQPAGIVYIARANRVGRL